MGQCIETDVRWTVRGENDELAVVRVGDDDLFAPVAKNVPVEGRVETVGVDSAKVRDPEQPREAVGRLGIQPVSLLKLSVVVKLHQHVAVPPQA